MPDAKFELATVATPRGPRAALRVADRTHALDRVAPELGEVSTLDLLRDWDASFSKLAAIAARLGEGEAESEPGDLLTPVLYPAAAIAVGANYTGHLKEMGMAPKKWDVMPYFIRPPSTSLVGPGATVRIPRATRQFDWECELAVFVGRTLRHASVAEAEAAVAGYSIGLDMSCRDLIPLDNELRVDLMRGKAQDTMAPCGPSITPAAFVGDVTQLRIQLSVNGDPMMDASTAEMLYSVGEMLSEISANMTIQPGDVLFTGSPSGSAAHHGNRWLQPGDRIHATITGLAALDVEMRADD